jgi:1,4-alpha-glucan branching enzyme
MAANTKEKSRTKGETLAKKLHFNLHAPEAKEVSLAGNFNGWSVSLDSMKKDKKGTWKASVQLEPGRYEYRFVVDGHWNNDPSCSECVPNEFGGLNCVVVVE